MQQAKRQRDTVAAIEKMGGWVAYDWQIDANGWLLLPNDAKPPRPAWLRQFLGDDFFAPVSAVVIESPVTDAGLAQLKGLT